MDHTHPSTDQWKELYELALRVKDLAPWTWMEEGDVFGVRDPRTNRLGFVSVMGMLGEHLAVSVYPGEEALHDFWDFAENGTSPERLLEIPQIQVSFGGRDELDKEDRGVVKHLGYKFRGRNAWPLFRSYRPGFAPWLLEADEARVLATALGQLLDVAPRVRDEPTLLEPRSDDDYLVRVRDQGDGAEWKDHRVEVPPPKTSTIRAPLDLVDVSPIEDLPRIDAAVEIDLVLLPAPIQEQGARPYFPYILLIVETNRGVILCAEMLKPLPSLDEMRRETASVIASAFLKAQVVPAAIHAADERLLQVIEPLAKSLGIALMQASVLPGVDAAKESFFDHVRL